MPSSPSVSGWGWGWTLSIFFTTERPQGDLFGSKPNPSGKSSWKQCDGSRNWALFGFCCIQCKLKHQVSTSYYFIEWNDQTAGIQSGNWVITNPLLSNFFSLIFISSPTDYLTIVLRCCFPFSIINSCKSSSPLRLSIPILLPEVFHLVPCKPLQCYTE